MSRLALVVGINSYRDRWATLKNSVNDADEVEAILTEPEYGFAVTKLIEEEVSKAAVLRWLVEAKNSGAEQIVFYFSGHGTATDIGTFLVTHDNAEFDEGISLNSLLPIASPPPGSPTQVLIILDCCHSGGVVEQSSAGIMVSPIRQDDISRMVRQANPAVVVMAACTSDQSAVEKDNLGHGVFTHYLLSALLGDAADHTGRVTAHSVYDVVSREMAGQEGNVQVPVFLGRVEGQLILGRGFTPVLSPPLPEEDYHRYEMEAREHLQAYHELKASYSADSWRHEGYFAASRKLEEVANWFTRREKVEGLSRRPSFQQCRDSLIRYQSELGFVESQTKTRWGTLDRQIGAGGFGKVWRITKNNGDALAYKLYHAYELTDREKIKRFRNGYEAMRMLSHPAIIKVHDYSECPAGFTMDYIDGSNLRELSVGTFMEQASIFSILAETAEAINHAHQHNVIHRDIKPENIVCRLGENGDYRPFLTDFDLAWFSTQTQKVTKTAMGVIYYAAPEQYIAYDPKMVRSKNPTLDVFSFGQLAYFCLTNRDPDPLRIEDNCNALRQKLAHSCSVSAISKIIELYRGCTRFDAAERIQTFAEVLAMVVDIRHELTHSDVDAQIGLTEYTNELIFQMNRGLSQSVDGHTFVSASGNWQVTFEWREQQRKRNLIAVLNLHVQPTRRVALQNISNDKMRRVLNQRIDNCLNVYGNRAQRHPGQKGEFEFYIDWNPDAMTRTSVLELCRMLQDVFSSLDSI
ncbi:protein kinase domain-containing protein [Streptomyces sp. NPDC001414]